MGKISMFGWDEPDIDRNWEDDTFLWSPIEIFDTLRGAAALDGVEVVLRERQLNKWNLKPERPSMCDRKYSLMVKL